MCAQFKLRALCSSLLITGMLAAASHGQGFGRGGGDAEDGGRRGFSKRSTHADALSDVLRMTIAPSTWDQVGGEGSLAIVEPWGIAVISQTRSVHEEIEALLATIRTVRGQQDGTLTPEVRSASAEDYGAGQSVKQIEKALRSTTTLSLSDVPLADAIETINQQHGIQIAVDRRALEDSGLTDTFPVQVKVSGISLRSALNLLLDDAGLTYVIANEVLMVTTPEAAESRLVTRVYPIRDLLSQ